MTGNRPWRNNNPGSSLLNYKNNVGDTTKVGKYSPLGDSPYGALDMAGNTWEWVTDWYAADYYSKSPLNNPSGPVMGEYRVLRGGCWFDDSGWRTAERVNWRPHFADDGMGFRCAFSP